MYFASLLQDLFPFGHGRKKLLRWLKSHCGRLTVARSSSGDHLLLDRENYIDHQVLLYGHFEGNLIEGFCRRLRETKVGVFLDVGANIGLYSLAVAKIPSVAKIVAFEPDPRNFSQLAGNVFLNGLAERIELRSEALSNASGKMTFYVNRAQDGFISGQSGFGNRGEGFIPITITASRADDLLDFEGETVGVKIDVEGFEQQALEGMRRLFSKNRVLMQIEIFEENMAKVDALLSEMGFALRLKLTPTGCDYLYSNFSLDEIK